MQICESASDGAEFTGLFATERTTVAVRTHRFASGQAP